MPRDPSRIDPIIEQLRALWKTHPDMRLGQLIENVAGANEDIFNIEDDDMRERMTEYANINWNVRFHKG